MTLSNALKVFVVGIYTALLGVFIFVMPAHAIDSTDISIQQQLFTVEPTLNIEELERYSQRGVLSSNFVRFGIPLILLSIFIAAGYFLYLHHQRVGNKKTVKSRRLQTVVIGSLNALSLLIAFTLIGGIFAPTSLKNLAVYVDEGYRFQAGDTLRTSFQIVNVGDEEETGLVFSNEFSEDLHLVESSVILEKTGSLPDDYLPLTTRDKIVVNIGTLLPGESATIEYDFEVLRDGASDILNVARVSDHEGNEAFSNSVVIRRLGAEEQTFELPSPGTSLLRDDSTGELYFVTFDDILRPISIPDAERIYGPGWTFDVSDVSGVLLVGSTFGPAIASTEYPDGLYLTDGESRCYIESQRCRPVTESGIRKLGLSDRYLRVVSTDIIQSFELGELIDA